MEKMEILDTLLGSIGFVIGTVIGLLVGYFIFIYFQPRDVTDPIIRPLLELDYASLLNLFPEIPLWVKHYDYDRVDWLNECLANMWPYIDKAVCARVRSDLKPILDEYTNSCFIRSIDFETITLGTLPPILYGMKVHESNDNELIFEPAVRWAGIPNITLVIKVLLFRISVQLIDIQIFAAPRIVLKPLVPSFPCFSNLEVSLLEKPFIDFGLKFIGGDIMAIPVLYQYIQTRINKEIAKLYLWPQSLQVSILDSSVGAVKKPLGILHVKIVRAVKLMRKDFIGSSDPYVELSLSGEKLPAKKTSVKMRNLNPEWNEEFKLSIKDLNSQVLQLHVYDWEKVGAPDKLGMAVVPLRPLVPHEVKEYTLDLVKNLNPNDPQNKKRRGQIAVQVTFNPFKEDNEISGTADKHGRKHSLGGAQVMDPSMYGAGLLMVNVQGAEDVEGRHHNNPYAVVIFRGERKKTKMIRKTQNPVWNEEFQFMLEEAPLQEKLHIKVNTRRTGFGFRSKESLGYVEIKLIDVVYNGRINDKFNLINSRNGMIHLDIRWKVI